jgi:hypothetical protein
MAGVLASLVNLDKPGHYIHWGVIQISVANLVVIGLMVLVFVLALFVPFPKPRATEPTEVEQP